MFKFALIALLPILAVAAQTAQPGHLARQTPSAADCATPCTALSDSVSAAGGGTGGLAALCTDTITTNYANCYGCQVKSAGLAQTDAQQAIDAYAQGCKAGGTPRQQRHDRR
ncbi:hypothetical protein DFH09DRAFT_615546 [Mycena vulgaris]|nr:hypothetical protein DFH09DRAFT_615546 [Mycena vulgaris]